MRNDEDTYTRVYRGLRGALARAELRPAAQIRVDETARAYRVSPTPVREALAQLLGERLVKNSRRHGYFVPCPDADTLTELFTLCEMHILAAIRVAARHGTLSAPEAREPGGQLLGLLVQARMPVLIDSGILILERLALARSVEEDVLDPAARSLDAPVTEGAAGLARMVTTYCRRRRAGAPALARAIAARSGQGSEYIPDMV
jgi:DNA-binding transcriptional regulator YhcF (GntR family)